MGGLAGSMQMGRRFMFMKTMSSGSVCPCPYIHGYAHNIQTSSSLKPLGQPKLNFMWIKIIVRSFGSSKNTKLEDGPYCTISGNEPSSVTLYKTGSESQTFCCNFKNLHLCSPNQRLKFPKGPNNQNNVKKTILNI